MRICLLVTNLGSGGAERTITYLADYGIQKNYKVDIVVLNNERFYNIPDNVNYFCLDDEIKKKGVFAKAIRIAKRMLRFRKYVKKNKPDLIFSIMDSLIRYPHYLAPKTVLISSERNNPKLEIDKKKQKKRIKYFEKTDGLIFQTNSARECYKSLTVESEVIPNAVGNPIAYEYSKPAESREKVITAVGRLAPQKDYYTLINAFEIVHNLYPDYKLQVFGEGSEKDALKEYVTSKKLDNVIVFCGVDRECLRKVYTSTCYVMTSKHEGMPNTLMEAMAVGTPCVSTNCDFGPADLIENNVNGQLVPVGDYKAVAEAIIRYIEDKEFSEKVSVNSMKIKETNSIEKISERYYTFFEKIYSKKKSK